MRKGKDEATQTKALQKRAEKMLDVRPQSADPTSEQSLKNLVHQLEIHQVELELQNEELRKTQVELATSRDRYTDLYEFAPIAYVTLDNRGRILEGNLMAAKLLGIERRTLLRANLAKFI